MNELREKMIDVIRESYDPDMETFDEEHSINAILDAVIAALPKPQEPVSEMQRVADVQKGAQAALEDVHDILQAAKEKK